MLLFCEFVNLNCAYRCVTVEYELSVMDNLYLLKKSEKTVEVECRKGESEYSYDDVRTVPRVRVRATTIRKHPNSNDRIFGSQNFDRATRI